MIEIKINKVYDAVIGGNYRAIRYTGSNWEETDEYDEEIQDYINWKRSHLQRFEIEKIIGDEYYLPKDE